MRKSTLVFIEFVWKLIKGGFALYDPETAQRHLFVEQYTDLLGKLNFIHHSESKVLMRDIFDEMGSDLEKTYFDVPKMQSFTSDNYLTMGIAYASNPHRETWYSVPPCQVNWWIPIYDIQLNNVRASHRRYRNISVKNSSRGYNYSV